MVKSCRSKKGGRTKKTMPHNFKASCGAAYAVKQHADSHDEQYHRNKG